ncbi:uncharacterized protein H6S33_000636 [Morchella sextelata]|uniref:uncharacterized protein n=1 Tax=Morchella sextelata TaxID=1174677 RepID=UPI001D05673B|nr:uncharacterized protein H6S33_000636 [Morchella sextelata]KAH0615000.1 hypothetical protein H6S33_000636 [Morchella sextelata]
MSPALLASGTSTLGGIDSFVSCLKQILSTIEKSSLEPPLGEPDFDAELLGQIKPATQPVDELYKSSLEIACKTILYELATKDTSVSNETLVAFGNLLDLALVFAELEISEPGLPLALIEELFDSQTIPSCELLFQYLESRIERVTAGIEGSKGKGLILLRLLNELLRRLSKTEDTIFCGRILIFLSKSFPIGEKSGVNLRGEFNTQNVTVYDDTPPQEPVLDVEMEVDTKEEEVKTEESISAAIPEGDVKSEDGTKGAKTVSFTAGQEPKTPSEVLSTSALYPIFWSLQRDFADPQRLLQAPESLETFKKGLAATMARFQIADEEAVKSSGIGEKKDNQTSNSKRSDDKKASLVVTGEKRKRDDEEDDSHGEGFNPKYLTSRELFELEISDLTFRRHVLVQAMVLIDFLLSLTPGAKDKWKDIKTPNRAVQYSYTLSPEDEQWAISTRTQISNSLQPNQSGRLFMRLINTVLTREQNWVRWKAESCQPFDMLPLAEEEFEDAKLKAEKQCISEAPFRYVMGTPTLSRLWQGTGDASGMEGLTDEERHRIPTPESFRAGVQQAQEDIKDSFFPQDIEEAQNAKFTKTWKALRIASRDRFHLFNKFDDKFDEERNDLEMLFDVDEKTKEEAKPKVNQQA